MKQLSILILCILLLGGCKLNQETMYIKPVEMPEDETQLIKLIGGHIYEFDVDETIKMATIKGVRYTKGTEPQILINHQMCIDKEISNKEYKLLLQFSDSIKYYSLAFWHDGCGSFSEKVFHDSLFKWQAKSSLNERISISAGVAIPLIVMSLDENNSAIYETSYYVENPDIINEYDDIFILSITFDTELHIED